MNLIECQFDPKYTPSAIIYEGRTYLKTNEKDMADLKEALKSFGKITDDAKTYSKPKSKYHK